MSKSKVICDTDPGVTDALVPGDTARPVLDFFRRTLLGSSSCSD